MIRRNMGVFSSPRIRSYRSGSRAHVVGVVEGVLPRPKIPSFGRETRFLVSGIRHAQGRDAFRNLMTAVLLPAEPAPSSRYRRVFGDSNVLLSVPRP